MTDPRNRHRVRGALGVAICYVLALQAFLAAYSTAFAVAWANPFGVSLVICHGVGGPGASGGDAGGPAGGTEKSPCALCAVAAAGGALTPEPASIVAPQAMAGRIDTPVTAETLPRLPVRAGLARAPPSFA